QVVPNLLAEVALQQRDARAGRERGLMHPPDAVPQNAQKNRENRQPLEQDRGPAPPRGHVSRAVEATEPAPAAKRLEPKGGAQEDEEADGVDAGEVGDLDEWQEVVQRVAQLIPGEAAAEEVVAEVRAEKLRRRPRDRQAEHQRQPGAAFQEADEPKGQREI